MRAFSLCIPGSKAGPHVRIHWHAESLFNLNNGNTGKSASYLLLMPTKTNSIMFTAFYTSVHIYPI
jgi:hypothetical protein